MDAFGAPPDMLFGTGEARAPDEQNTTARRQPIHFGDRSDNKKENRGIKTTP